MSEIDLDASDDRFLVIDGRRWRRTDPALPEQTVAELTSHLGRGRAAVRSAKAADDAPALASARRRVGLAKHGLGERGAYWWEREPAERLRDAELALAELARLDDAEH